MIIAEDGSPHDGALLHVARRAFDAARSLRDRNDRSEKVENRGQIFTI